MPTIGHEKHMNPDAGSPLVIAGPLCLKTADRFHQLESALQHSQPFHMILKPRSHHVRSCWVHEHVEADDY